MKASIAIPLEGFPEAGMLCRGEADSALLGTDNASMRSSGPIRYDLEAQLFDTELVVRGSAEAPFTMRCERCLEEFAYTVRVENITISRQIEPEDTLADITEEVREELVLALPAYPKCEISGKECQINDIIGDFRLDKAPSSGVDCATPSGESVWQALDKFTGSPAT